MTDDIAMTRLALGTGRLHDRDPAEPVTPSDAIALVRGAAARGVTTIDTAPKYGGGSVESAVGVALRELDQPITLSTKVGTYPPGFDYTAAAATASITASLSRLGRPSDILYAHELKPDTVDRVLAPGGSIDGMRRALDDGHTRALGFTTSNRDCALRAIDSARFEYAMLWMAADLLDDTLLRSVAPAAVDAGQVLVVASPFAAGLLTPNGGSSGRLRRRLDPASEDRLERLHQLASHHGVDIGALAVQYPFRFDGVRSVVAGPQRPAQLEEQLRWMTAEVDESVWTAVDHLLTDKAGAAR